MEHELNNKLFINGSIENGEHVHGICNALLKMGITKGDLTRIEPFTEGQEKEKDSFIKPYHGIEYTVIKVIKVTKQTWNYCFYSSVEIFLDSNHVD